MCVIIYSPNGKNRPSQEILEQCQEKNPDGIGIAFQDGKKWLKYHKGLGLDDLYEQMEKRTTNPLVIHFRLASVGEVCGKLCHPFPNTRETQLWCHAKTESLLFTNGTWKDWRSNYNIIKKLHGCTKNLKGLMSDTRAMAHIIALTGKIDWLQHVQCMSGIRRGKPTAVRSLVWKVGRRPKKFGRWHKHEGCEYSNLLWQPRKPFDFPERLGRSASVQDILGTSSWNLPHRSKLD